MQRTILFAAAVYQFKEGKDCLQNILDFSQGYVVAHLNPMMPNATVHKLKVELNNTRTFFNPERLLMKTPHKASPHSLLDIFVSNVKFSWFLSWKFVIHFTQNERIVRTGIDAFFASTLLRAGFTAIPRDGCEQTWVNHTCRPHHDTSAIYDKLWSELPRPVAWRYGQVDGAFLRRDVTRALKYHSASYDTSICCPQEKFLPSIMPREVGVSITYINWNGDLRITCEDIQMVKKGEMEGVFAVKRANNLLLNDCAAASLSNN